MQTTHKYDDIIQQPRPVSFRRAHMTCADRAAQFSPFAALRGHDAAIQETARLTDARVELDEDAQQRLDEKLQLLRDHLEDRWQVAITYFVPDIRKAGGAYRVARGIVRKMDVQGQRLVMEHGENIPISQILQIDAAALDEMEL